MKNHFKIFLFLLIALLNPLVVHAEDRNRNANFFLTLGRTFIDLYEEDEKATSLKFGTGYRFSDYAGFEVFYIYYGQISERVDVGNTITLNSSAFVINAIALYPINPLFDLYGKIGVSLWDAELKFQTSTFTDDGTDPIYTLGFGYNIDHDSTIRFEYERSNYGDAKFSVISFGFQHNF
ncbi:outer membrane beta-barrel protein [Kaarinaea lacus]